MRPQESAGLFAKDIPPEKLERLLNEGYSISPNSGRLRKRIRTKRTHSPLSKRKVKKITRIVLWTFLVIAFLVSLVIILPELAVQNGPIKNPRNIRR